MSSKVIVFIHGFMGRSRQFEEIVSSLEGCGADLKLCVLDGHEKKTFQEFRQSSAKTWQSGADKFIDKLRADYDEILLVGHSMGGLIAVQSAIACPEKIKGIVAIGFPVKVRLTPAWFKNNILASKPPREGESEYVAAARKLGGVHMDKPSDYFRTMPNNMQFMSMRARTGKGLYKLSVPLSVINMEKDEIVAPGTQKFVAKKLPNADFMLLKESGHFLFRENEVTIMANEIRRMLDL